MKNIGLLSRTLAIVAMLMAVCRGPAQQAFPSQSENKTEELKILSSEEQADVYNIYSTVLKVQEPDVPIWTIIQNTKNFALCLKPAHDEEGIYRSVIEDYAEKNKKVFVLEQKFSLAAYTLAGPEEWSSTNRGKAIAVFSAIGFNPDRTRAAVCFWARSGGTCNFLIQQQGAWQVDRNWRGDACGWAA